LKSDQCKPRSSLAFLDELQNQAYGADKFLLEAILQYQYFKSAVEESFLHSTRAHTVNRFSSRRKNALNVGPYRNSYGSSLPRFLCTAECEGGTFMKDSRGRMHAFNMHPPIRVYFNLATIS
jgi:hypothetical protein